MTLAFPATALVLACSSLAAMVDMADPSLQVGTGLYAGNRVSVTALMLSNRCIGGIVVTKKRAGSPRLAIPRILLGPVRSARRSGSRHQHGIDHMDHAVGLVDVRDRDHRGSALGV